mmetsp:Transcript_333/g.1197  ORF Transcript_333/g.1197 Transcript_333/m.1197 type:complete len:258 (+) Transcript_333:2344-3117(+)|eukprot:CAMPEP_0117443334 /NCGR_PEP_ID=MMETSP0759-20121206/4640_1 /TAXON_ID=63605 /ORGANISM="Percolomonas cosmopolitus, Strain WS" /LENGTH=257 /DNA_ID=CAMNT_0005235303 /DNA_START=2333 /DNA_END=3106 /DNA_ORIENTATION=+
MTTPDFQLVRYKLDKSVFEIAVHPATVPLYRQKKKSMDDTLFVNEIFRDFGKGDVVSQDELSIAFETTDKQKILEKILTDGEYQLSTKERRDFTEKKLKEIVQYLHKYFIDPKTLKPHPPARIETALSKVKFTADYKQSAESQAKAILSKLKDQIPLKKSTIEAELQLSHQSMGKCSGIIAKYCRILGEKYTGEGVQYGLEIIPGDLDTFLKLLNDQTKGEYQLKFAGANAVSDTPTEEPSSGKGKRGKGKKGGRRK